MLNLPVDRYTDRQRPEYQRLSVHGLTTQK